MHVPIAAAAALALMVLPATMVQSHGNIMEPAAVWTKGYPMTGFSSEVDNLLWGPMDGQTYGYGPEGAVKYWTANFPKSSYKSLKELILAKQRMLGDGGDEKCGYTLKDESKRAALPAAIKHSGFFHPGPCEAWCDNTRIAYDVDCSKKYASGTIPIDTSKCAGANQLSLYWLAVHGAPWQVYSDCVWLKGGSGGDGNSTTPSVTSKVPTTTFKTPSVTSAPTATTTTKPKTPAPKVTTASPVASDATPSPTKKCKRRSSRLM